MPFSDKAQVKKAPMVVVVTTALLETAILLAGLIAPKIYRCRTLCPVSRRAL
ncbi:MAG: hypothetical protein IPL73_09220 [Candidatus Obscuribacter sp.]|nr:hypothetical protein [Candidatus Obscuribacter sp.]